MLRRSALLLAILLGLCAPAGATELLNLPITAAVSATAGPALQLQKKLPGSVTVQAVFTYVASGATSVDAYVQTSLDGGTTWVDVTDFHFTTASAKKIVNLSSLTPVTTAVTPTDGSMSSNTSVDGIVGTQWRVKYVVVGTYGIGTILRIDAIANGLTQ